MSITQKLTGSAPSNAAGAAYNGDFDKLVAAWTKSTADKLLKMSQKQGYNLEEFFYSFDERGITFRFPQYGAFMDMKTLFWTGMPNIAAIEKWVAKKPAGSFHVPGYQPGAGAGISQEKQNKRIAYGIAMAMASGEPRNNWSKYKRKRIWQQPQLGKSVAHLAHLIAEELAAVGVAKVITPILQR